MRFSFHSEARIDSEDVDAFDWPSLYSAVQTNFKSRTSFSHLIPLPVFHLETSELLPWGRDGMRSRCDKLFPGIPQNTTITRDQMTVLLLVSDWKAPSADFELRGLRHGLTCVNRIKWIQFYNRQNPGLNPALNVILWIINITTDNISNIVKWNNFRFKCLIMLTI